MGRAEKAQLAVCLAVGLALRIAVAARVPVVFDEVDVVAYGVARGLERGGLVFEVPLAVSNGITPLWFWLQALPIRLFGPTSAPGLRAVPVVLGLLTVALAHRVGGRMAGARAGFLSGLLFATASPLVYTNALGQFSESLTVPLLLLLLLDLQPPRGAQAFSPPWRVVAWPAAMLLTYLGKGLLVYAAYAVTILGGYACPGPPVRLRSSRLPLLLALPLVPALVWLVAAQSVVFAGGGALKADIGVLHSVVEAVRPLTWGYGSQAKEFMVGTPKDALWVYTDFTTWPTLCVLAVPLAITVVALARDLARCLAARDGEGARRALVPLGLACPVAAVLIARGALDVRFHLLYLPVLLPCLAVRLDGWIARIELRSRGLGEWAPWLLAGTLVAVGLVAGPLQWAPRWAWEPGPHEIPREAGSFPNADVQLAARMLEREGPFVARSWMQRALERHPRDRATLLEAGGGLLQGGGGDAALVALAAEDYLRHRPADEDVRSLLEKALTLK